MTVTSLQVRSRRDYLKLFTDYETLILYSAILYTIQLGRDMENVQHIRICIGAFSNTK